MSLDVRMRYYRLWVGEEVVGVLQAPPLEMQQISPVFLLVGHREGWRRALHWQADENTCLNPAPPPGLHGTALASVKAPETRPSPGNAARRLITQKKTISQAPQEPVARLSACVKRLRTPPNCLRRLAKVRYSSSVRAQCQDAEPEQRRLKVT